MLHGIMDNQKQKIIILKEKLDRIEQALHNGIEVLQDEDSKVIYRSTNELNSIRTQLLREISKLENPNEQIKYKTKIVTKFNKRRM